MLSTLWLLAVSTAAFLPILLFYMFDSDFTRVASESLGYRFFYSMRLLSGPDQGAWLPQGQLLTILQHGINLFLLPSMDASIASLRAALNIFAYWSIGLVNLFMVAIFVMAALARSITWQDRTLLTIVAFAPLYGQAATMTWALWPDYLLLNVYLTAAALFLFQWQWRSQATTQPTLRTLAAGAFIGMLAANKVNMVLVGAPLLAAIIFTPGMTLPLALRRAVLAGLAALITFAFIFAAAGLFRGEWLMSTTRHWFDFIMSPGGDVGFVSQILTYLKSAYGLMVASWLLAVVIAALTLRPVRDLTLQKAGVAAAALAGSAAVLFFIFKRPAGTTLGESSQQLLMFGAVLITIVPLRRVTVPAVGALAAAFAALVLWEQPLAPVLRWARYDGQLQNNHWRFFAKATAQAPKGGTAYYIPDNRYQYGDAFIILLKGASDFPTWTISSNGQWIIDRYAPGLSFVSGCNADTTPASGSRAVWYEDGVLKPVPDCFPQLGAAIAGAQGSSLAMPIASAGAGPQPMVKGHIVNLR